MKKKDDASDAYLQALHVHTEFICARKKRKRITESSKRQLLIEKYVSTQRSENVVQEAPILILQE